MDNGCFSAGRNFGGEGVSSEARQGGADDALERITKPEDEKQPSHDLDQLSQAVPWKPLCNDGVPDASQGPVHAGGRRQTADAWGGRSGVTFLRPPSPQSAADVRVSEARWPCPSPSSLFTLADPLHQLLASLRTSYASLVESRWCFPAAGYFSLIIPHTSITHA